MEKFQQLNVWKKAHDLVLTIYKITTNYPSEEKYSLVNQMRRSAISVSANIVEGTKRKTTADRSHFHVMADTSLEELKYYLILSADLNFLNRKDADNILNKAREIGAMLNSLTRKL